MDFLKIIIFCLFLILASCKTPQIGSGGGGGGSTPTADDLNDYINRMTTPENKTCDDVKTDSRSTSKYPIIYPSGKNQWKNEFSKGIADQFDKDYMRPLRKQKLNEGDLSLLGCTGYNYATDEEKKQFWILFMASISKPESNFNSDEEYREGNGSVSTGILQIDSAASNNWCGILSNEMKKRTFSSGDMHNPTTNLQCGLLMMQWQVMGVPKGKPIKMTEPQFEGRLFTGNSFWYWSTLSDRNSNGKREIIDWFRVHAQRQFKFCNRKNPIDGYTPGLSSKYKEMNCEGVQDTSERENCEKYIINAKVEMDVRIGENGSEKSCQLINNTKRSLSKSSTTGDEGIDENGEPGISK
jgi:hypothetical protein